MTPVIPSSTSNISVIPGCSFVTRPTNSLIRCCNLRKSAKRTLYAQDCILPLSTSLRLFPYHKPRFAIVSATGVDVDVDVAVEQVDQPDSPVSEQDAGKTLTTPSSVDKSDSKQRSRPVRKSEMPPVKDEELVPGATFTGKVRSIQPFGAFIDFGAFTDGLVHVSRLSDSYVKDVSTVVSVGQEVKVKLVEANIETGRISLTMRESEPSSGGDKSRPPKRNTQKSNQRRDEGRKMTKFVKGQDLEGTVKNLTRSGAFISLPEGEEGFLPASEEADEGFGSIMGGSSLEVGQEVKVRVLRIARGQVTLTMKKEEDAKALDSKLQGTVYTATNPFLVAFRKNKDIASFLDEREKEDTTADSNEVPSVAEVKVDQESQETVEVKSDGDSDETDTSSSLLVEDEKKSVSSEVAEISSLVSDADEKVKPVSDEDSSITNEEQVQIPIDEGEISSPQSVQDEISEPTPEETSEVSSPPPIQDEISEPTPEEMSEVSSPPPIQDEISEPTPEETSEVSSPPPIQDEKPEPAPEETSNITSSNEQEDAPVIQENVIEEIPTSEIVANQIEETTPKVEVDTEIPSATLVEDEKIEATPEQNDIIANSNGQSSATLPPETTTKATISPALVKQLREETGAGMMDCKKALVETKGDLVKAQEYLRKKGLASADKKASRATAEGRIGSYVHDSRIGVLIEVNCETDFVSRGDIFKELVNDLAMQVAACPQVQYLVTDDVPKEIIEKEKAIEMQKEDLLSKPEQFRSRIVEGRIKKRLEELALLEQPYIKDDKVLVKDFVKSTVATIGENIKVNRFVRFNLGEGLEKRSQDFAAEVAAQTSAKPVSAPAKEQQPAAIETAEEAPKTAISAALVKQLREETGAGMMDCKKALSETQGNLEKAQEYLRKKGLSTADKKSSRLAAEGRIGSYIHDSRIGVLIEVNCETDFVGRSEKFKDLVEDLAMQVVACPKVEYVSVDDIPESVVSKEKELEMQREDILSKPESIRERIVEGRVSKRLGELALLEQVYLKDDTVLVKDLVKQSVAAIGENIKVRRFVRFTLGESSELRSEETESSESKTES